MAEAAMTEAIAEILPIEVIDQLRLILAARPSGTLVFHVKDGAVLAGEFEHKDKLTIPKKV